MENGVDYDESLFTPVIKEGRKLQYFAKVYYTLTPRCLTVPVGASKEDKAQVLPAFITKVTNPSTLAELTPEQKSYRYIVSGKTRFSSEAESGYSSDGHMMYTAAANKPSYVDVPLGGDSSPPALLPGGKSYDWTPDYKGNLLFPYAAPLPILIPNSVAGPNTPIAKVREIDSVTGAVTYEEGNDAAHGKLNGFLGSITANDTIALSVQAQIYTTDEMKNGISAVKRARMAREATPVSPLFPAPETSVNAAVGTYPNSDYLQAQNDPSGSQPAFSSTGPMESNPNPYPEFNLDMGMDMPSNEIGISDYVTITMDGYSVGFSIGVPLGGYSKDPTDGTGNDGAKNPADANKDNFEKMGKLMKFLASKKADKAGTLADADETWGNAKGGEVKSQDFSVGVSISVAFLFQYNQLDNTYYFSQFTTAIAAELSYRIQFRLTVCPIFYGYIAVGVGVEIGTGLSVERTTVCEPTSALPKQTLQRGRSVVFETGSKAFDISYKGKLYAPKH